MGKLLIVNGSPRAPRSNSKRYAALLKEYLSSGTDEYNVTEKRHREICKRLGQYDGILFVFPLYADGLPVTLMYFLKELETYEAEKKPAVHVLINCGFLEPEQNDTAVEMIRFFCRKNGFPFGAALCIGSGEAILETPFVPVVKRGLKKFAKAVERGGNGLFKARMPLTKRMFVRASSKFWEAYGAKNHVTKEEMQTMKIEG